MTQEGAARLLGMSQGNVSKLCKFPGRISFDTAKAIEAKTNGEVPLESWPKFAFIADPNRSHVHKVGNSRSGLQGAPVQKVTS